MLPKETSESQARPPSHGGTSGDPAELCDTVSVEPAPIRYMHMHEYINASCMNNPDSLAA